MKEKIKLLFTSSRPVSWINTAYPFAAGYLVTGGNMNAQLVIGTLFFLIPYNLLMYGVNDVFDYESDMRNPRKGGIEGAITPKKFHKLIIWTSGLLCVPFVLTLMLLGTLTSNIILLILIFFVVAYSINGLRFKEKPFLDSITSSIHFVGPLVYALTLTNSLLMASVYVAAFFLWGIASHSFGAVQDIVPDKEANIGSIATVLGARTTVRFSFICYSLAIILCATQNYYSFIVGLFGCLYLLNIWPYVYISEDTSSLARAGWKRFIWINYIVGAVITICLILHVT